MKKLMVSAFVLAAVLYGATGYTQGCSDAGFCTAGAIYNTKMVSGGNDKKKTELGFSFGIGMGEQSTTILTPQLEYRRFIGKKTWIEAKLPYYMASGNIGSHSGIGDPIVTLSGNLYSKNKITLDGTGGLRIGIASANAADKNGRPLPMPYQNSLGTTDLILGLRAGLSPYFSITAAYQQPLAQYNKNAYDSLRYPAAGAAYNSYFSSAKLQRSADILIRPEAQYQWSQFSISGGVLFIYHLANDKADNLAGTQYALNGSNGLTINIAAHATYTIRNMSVSLAFGAPLQVRDRRPDGLTRSMVLTPKIAFRF